MKKYLEDAKDALDKLFDRISLTTNEETKALICDYLKWIKIKTELISNKDNFTIPEGIAIKRGMVFWFNFGCNIDEEFSGKHPGIVLRVGGKTAIVAPLSSKEPTKQQLESGVYVEISKVYNFKNIRRWVNVLNITPISLQRIDFCSPNGNIKGPELDKINDGIKKAGLWK